MTECLVGAPIKEETLETLSQIKFCQFLPNSLPRVVIMDDVRAFKGVFLALCRIICVICEAEASENNQVEIIGRFFHYLNKGNRIEVRLVGTPKIAYREYSTK